MATPARKPEVKLTIDDVVMVEAGHRAKKAAAGMSAALNDLTIQRRVDKALPHIRNAVDYENEARTADNPMRAAYLRDLHDTALAEAARVMGGAM